MASNEEFCVDGTPISELRVVDLKEQLEKRGLSKSGSKNVLLKRLKDQLALEKLQAAQMGKDPAAAPNMEMKTCGNDLVAEYLEKQQQMLQAAKLAAARSAAAPTLESSMSPAHSGTPSTPDADRQLVSPPAGKRSRSTRVKSPRNTLVEEEPSSSSGYCNPVVAASAPFPPPAGGNDKADAPGTKLVTASDEYSTTVSVAAPPAISDVNTGTTATTDASQETPGTRATEQQESPAKDLAAEKVPDEPMIQPPGDDTEKQAADVEPPPAKHSTDEFEPPSPKKQEDDGCVQRAGGVHVDLGEGATPAPERVCGEVGREEQDNAGDDSMDQTKTAATVPVDEQDEVEMEISAPINAAEEIFEAVNTATAASTGGSKVNSENEDSQPTTNDKENRDIPQRKRKWVAATRTKRTPVSISSDSLKDIVGSVSESVKEDTEEIVEEEEVQSPPPKRIVIAKDSAEDETDTQLERRVEIEPTRPSAKVTEDGFVRVSTPSPARHPPNNIVHIRGLTRPFTLPALYDVLSKYGTFSKEDFWIDGIKSHCIVKYSNEEEAALARERLHNVQWPSSNSKMLRVDFATQEDLDRHQTQEEPGARANQQPASRDGSGELAAQDRREGRKIERSDRTRRSVSPSSVTRDRDRSWDRGKTWRSGESPPTDPRGAGGKRRPLASPERRGRDAKGDDAASQPAKLLDELFRKTKATPCIYWLPLSEEQIRNKERERKKREQERYERLRKLEDEDRDRRRDTYRRYSPHDYRNRRR